MVTSRDKVINPQQYEFGLDELTDGIRVTWSSPDETLSFDHSYSRANNFKRISAKNQALLKACSNRQGNIHTILDLTGGWGIDSFTLAFHGKQVTLLEQSQQVYSVLSKSLVCALNQKHTSNAARQIKSLNINSLDYLSALENHSYYDCIYLDPMFPVHKSTAKPGKEMQILQKLASNIDINACFEVALTRARNRVVVKRPAKADSISDRKPDMAYREKTIRFDVYLTAGAGFDTNV